MSFKAKIAAGAATFALAGGGLGMVGTLSASAATPSCGSGCSNLYTLKFGSGFIMDTFQARAAAGQEVILFQSSNSDKAEDFVKHDLGSVSASPVLSPTFATTYGTDEAYEFQYEPHGVNSHFCASTWPGQTARPGFKVRLEPCGQDANSIWAQDDAGGVPNVTSGYDVYINGATDRFSNPLVLNYPMGHPTDMPRPWLNVQPLSDYSDGTVFDNQQWSFFTGPV